MDGQETLGVGAGLIKEPVKKGATESGLVVGTKVAEEVVKKE